MVRIALGPLQYAWPRERLFGFYERVAQSAADIVYLGEVVCPRRTAMKLEDWLSLAGRLRDAGKEVVLSSLALPEEESDLRLLERIAGNGAFRVEANDMAAVSMLSARGLPFVAGAHLNVYHAATLRLLAGLGAFRWVPPFELSREAFARIERDPAIEVELFVYGRVPLAFSARCFTARRRGLEKDDCGIACLDYPEGLPLATAEGADFLVLNGIQTQSFAANNLVAGLDDLRGLGVTILRLSPTANGAIESLALLRRALDGGAAATEAAKALPWLTRLGSCDGFWRGGPGMSRADGEGA